MDGLRSAVWLIDGATVAEDLFGPLTGTADEQLRNLNAAYRKLVGIVHPDKHSAVDSVAAHVAFVRATNLKHEAEIKIRARTYGDRKPVLPVSAPRVVTARKRTYVVGDLVASGDLADLYTCTFEERGEEQHALFKLVKCAEDADLLENEARVLADLYPADQPEEKFYRYLPRSYDSFALAEDDGTRRRVNVLARYGAHVSLDEVMTAHPRGVDWRDMVWMVKRILVALGFVHRQGWVHGAILPPHVLVHPVNHGARIVDWCYATRDGGRLGAMSKPWRAYYAPEIPGRKAVSAATDIYMAMACAVALVGGDIEKRRMPREVPEPLARFVLTCLAPPIARRPDDAWKLHDDLDELLRRLVGKPKYRPLPMPAKGA